MPEAKFSGWHKGWLACRGGKIVRTVHRTIRVFKTEAEALAAARKSTIGAFRMSRNNW